MKVNGNNLKAGMIVSHKGGMWKVISTQSVKPGKGGAFAQVELKNLKDSSKLNERFRSSEVVERLYVETKTFQYSYNDGDTYHFMDTNTYEQISLDKNIISELNIFLQDNMKVSIEFIDSFIFSIDLKTNFSTFCLEFCIFSNSLKSLLNILAIFNNAEDITRILEDCII